jgi:hypothetical protein
MDLRADTRQKIREESGFDTSGIPGTKKTLHQESRSRDVRKGDEGIVTWKSQPLRASGIDVS